MRWTPPSWPSRTRTRRATGCTCTSRSSTRTARIFLPAKIPNRTTPCAMPLAACWKPCRLRWPSSARTSTRIAASARSTTCRTRRAGVSTTVPWPCACRTIPPMPCVSNTGSRARMPTPTCCCRQCWRACTTARPTRSSRALRWKATPTSRTSRACRTTCAMPCASWTTARSWRVISTRNTSISSSPARKASWPSSRTRSPTSNTTGTCTPCKHYPTPAMPASLYSAESTHDLLAARASLRRDSAACISVEDACTTQSNGRARWRGRTVEEKPMLRLFASLLLVLLPILVHGAPEDAVEKAEDSLRVFNWNDYIAPQVLKSFEAETGIRVEYRTFSSAEEMHAALAGSEPIDIIVPSHNDLPRLIKDGLLQPLDFSLLTNRNHLDKQLLSKIGR